MLGKTMVAIWLGVLFMMPVIASKDLPVLSGVGGNFHALDMYGKPMQLDDYKGKVVILGFGYTNCADICPFTLGYLKELYAQLPKHIQKNVQIMFVTIDPEYDTPEHLKDFIAYFNKDFIGITGVTKAKTDHIVKLFKAKYKQIGGNLPIEDMRLTVKKRQVKEEEARLYDHSVTLYVIDVDGETRNISYTGTPKEEFIANILALIPKPAIKVENFRIKRTAKNARSTAAYGNIINFSNQEDVLLRLSSPIAKRTELHETIIVDGFAKMVHRPNKIFKPNQTLTLKPMSYHIMFMGLNRSLDGVDTVDVTLTFKQAGDVPIQIKLER